MSALLQILPSGFALPPLLYLVGLLVAVGGVVALLYRVEPPVTDRVVTAFGPWMVAGATLYALFQVDAIPPALAPLFGSPAVYLTTFVVAGLVWAAVARQPVGTWELPSASGVLLVAGVAVAGLVVGLALSVGLLRGAIRLFWPVVGLALSLSLAAAIWFALTRRLPEIRVTGSVGQLVVVGHALDGVSTAIGTDVFGFGEQTPLSRAIIEFAASLPTAQYIGAGWLFAVVKLVLAALVVYLLAEYVEEAPEQGYLLLGLVAAVGLGPGVHNLVLFAIA